jgi:putative ABC transport system permease protein
MQALTNQPGGFNAIAVSNDGGVRGSEEHSDAVEATLHEALAGQGLGVDPAKEVAVDQAERIGNMITTIFVLLGSFSVMAGVLLIILIFTMLASERRAEMGMERAIGTQRSQLIQQFVSEGAGYAVVAGLVGALLGVLAVFGIAEGMNYIFGAEIPVEAKVNPRSMLLAYCLGTVITFLTVVISSWKISRLNVVAAIRDIPEIATRGRRKSTLLWGSLLTVLGGMLTFAGLSGSQAALFATGMSLLPFGVAILLRFFRVPGRPVFSLLGVYLLVFWLLPESTFSDLFGEFEFGIEMFFLSGMFMVVGATVLIMQNTDVLLAGVNRLGRLFRTKLPAVRTAVAYPSAARGRTGMTIAMFSLIIFSLVMMATMNQNYIESALGDESNAGWDVRGDTYAANAPTDLIVALQNKGVDTSGFAAVGVVTNPNGFTSKLRLAGTDEWKNWEVLGVDQAFLDHTSLKFGQRAAGYETDADVVQALATQANVAVIHADAVPAEGNLGEDETLLSLEGLKSSDESFEAITVELANPSDGSAYAVTIIGVLDSSIGSLTGMYASQATIDTVYPITTRTSYYVALEDETQSAAVAKQIEAALLQEGVQGIDIRDELKEMQKQESGFLYIIEGFMALGLFVGVAAVGVIAFRTVVERRQQIGMLRALGYSRELVSLSFLIETLFVVGLGVLTGTTLGVLLSRNLVMDPDQGFSPDISFVIPWTIIIPIVVLTIGVALLMTWIPARQASRIAPAEALRYE